MTFLKNALPLWILSLILFPFGRLQAQFTDPDHHLLWEISGNGLQQKSWLYGTYHSSDSRFFDFSDSVLICLDKADAYAMEVSMDDLVRAHSAMMLVNETQERSQNVIYGGGSRVFTDHKGRITSLALDHLPCNREWLYEGFGRTVSSLQDHYPTFLDAYLSNLAAEHGKPVYGLERLEDQLNVSDDDGIRGNMPSWSEEEETEKPNAFELQKKIPNLYFKGRLEEMSATMESLYGTESNYFHALIIHRNRGMMRRIVELTRQQSMFITAGTGHLGGSYGLLALLKEAGYTVRPVTAVFSGVRRNYEFNTPRRPQDWYHFDDAQSGYKVDFPAKPIFWPVPALSMRMQFYPNVGTGILYFAGELELPPSQSPLTLATLRKQMEQYLLEDDYAVEIDSRNIKMGDWKGFEILRKYVRNRHSRTRIFWNGNRGYFLMTITPKGYENSADALRFFDSFSPTIPQTPGPVRFASPEGAFTVKMPAEVDSNYFHASNFSTVMPRSLKQYWSQTTAGGTYCYAGYMDYVPGPMFLPPVSLESLIEDILDTRGLTEHGRRDIQVAGLEGVEIDFSEKRYLGSGLLWVLPRGNRRYILAVNAGADGNISDDARRFLESFKPISALPEHWEAHSTIDGDADFRVPSYPNYSRQFQPYTGTAFQGIEGLMRHEQGISSDPANGDWYLFLKLEFSELYQCKSQDTLLRRIHDLLNPEDGDTLFGAQPMQVGNHTGITWEAGYTPAGIRKEFLMVPVGNQVFVLAAGTIGEEAGTRARRFFDSFQIHTLPDARGLYSEKSQRLLEYLNSDDPQKWELAEKALRWVKLDGQSVETLSRTLISSMNRKGERARIFRGILIEQLAKAGGNLAIQDLVRLYGQGEDNGTRLQALRGLVWIGTEDAMAAYARILLNNPGQFTPIEVETTLAPLQQDSILFYRFPYASLLTVAEVPEYRFVCYEIFSEAQQEGRDIRALRPFLEQHLYEDFDSSSTSWLDGEPDPEYELDEYETELDEADYPDILVHEEKLRKYREQPATCMHPMYRLRNTLILLNELQPREKYRPALDKLAEVDMFDIRVEAAIVLTHWYPDAGKAWWDAFAEKGMFLNRMYRFLRARNLLELYPESVRNQQALGASALRVRLELDNEASGGYELEFLETLQREAGGKMQAYHLYRFRVDADAPWYVAVAGPFSTDSADLDWDSRVLGSEFREPQEMSMEKHLDLLIRELEEEE